MTVPNDTTRAECQSELLLLSTAIEQAAETILVTDRNSRILYVNPAFEKATGHTRRQVLGKTPGFLRSGAQNEAFYAELWRTLGSGRVWNGRMVNKRVDGSQYTVDATISPVRNNDREIVNFVAIERDVTHEVELEMQLRQAQKLEAVGSLAAGIAHEINTPIQFIGGNTEFLGDAFENLVAIVDSIESMIEGIDDRSIRLQLSERLNSQKNTRDYDFYKVEIEKAVAQTLEGVKRVSTIVRAMKDFSYPDIGQMSQSDINDIISTTVTVPRNEYKYVAEVELDLDPNLPEIDCLRNELHQVFLNLIVNAAHAIGESLSDEEGGRGVIRIKTRAENDFILVEISDNGCGIAPANQDRVFEPFFTTKDVGLGTGQGLALVRSIVTERHSGAISFETEPGRGTTFFIRFPKRQRTPDSEKRADYGNRNNVDEERSETGALCSE